MSAIPGAEDSDSWCKPWPSPSRRTEGLRLAAGRVAACQVRRCPVLLGGAGSWAVLHHAAEQGPDVPGLISAHTDAFL